MLGQHGIRDEINKLIRFYFDGKEDYRLAAKRATDAEKRNRLEELCGERELFHHELQEAVTRLAVEMSDNGTMTADLKRDWERLRGSVGGDGLDAALQLAARSDAHALLQAERLAEAGLPPTLQTIVERHVTALRKATSELSGTTGVPASAT
jgi:uncharacterized protein (TIGR02284 family)